MQRLFVRSSGRREFLSSRGRGIAMHKFLITVSFMFVCASAALAQSAEYPKFDFTAGYTLNFSNLRDNILLGHETFNGFTVAAAGNLNRSSASKATLPTPLKG